MTDGSNENKPKLGTANIEKAMDMITDVAKTAKKVTADGKINTDDIEHVKELASHKETLVAGAKAFKPALEEIKDLDAQECKALLLKLVGEVAEVAGT